MILVLVTRMKILEKLKGRKSINFKFVEKKFKNPKKKSVNFDFKD